MLLLTDPLAASMPGAIRWRLVGKTATVVSLKGGTVPQAAVPDEHLISTLEVILADAISGKLQAIAISMMDADQQSSYLIGGHIGKYSLIGATYSMLDDLTQMVRDPDA